MTATGLAETTVVVGLGEWTVSTDPRTTLVCLGLGSCVALCAYDPVAKVAGLAHFVLPTSAEGRSAGPGAKFVDTGIPLLIGEMERLGAARSRLVLKIVGGARMITAPGVNGALNIGDRNVASARSTLAGLGLRIAAEDTGGVRGRTVRLNVGTGTLTVSAAGEPGRPL
jgi:chemotaxis protein CheD